MIAGTWRTGFFGDMVLWSNGDDARDDEIADRCRYGSLTGQARRRTLPSSTAISSRTREQLLADRIWGSCLARFRRNLSSGGGSPVCAHLLVGS